jgi:hypothetical protein
MKGILCLAVCLTRVLLKAFTHSKQFEGECIFYQIEFFGASFWNMSKNINLKTGKLLCVMNTVLMVFRYVYVNVGV